MQGTVYANKDPNSGAEIAKRIVTSTEVSLLIRAAPSKRDRILLEVLYTGGLRVSEVVALTWSDVLACEEGRVQLSITGKGGKVRQVLLPAIVSRSLLSLRGDAGANDPLFASRKGASIAWLACACLSQCGEINCALSSSMPALAAARLTIKRIPR